ncbi:hypothetical protein CC77DRAFT_269936 [Alternaria alternata]|uniref:Uncharacterized protein n=1 Tax=Alternaria alternata TaxID=5599 RepID=A0A177DB93_ALTAL|nr:hypothetical protein CC77DRAFT_269936 [Alternaria alternata]OAG17053.1 hypothetical protein CC77DRAFT_269936 [Alternaria alternata]
MWGSNDERATISSHHIASSNIPSSTPSHIVASTSCLTAGLMIVLYLIQTAAPAPVTLDNRAAWSTSSGRQGLLRMLPRRHHYASS